MTGEITLRGKVLPIGGVKEKLLAAHRAGLTNIILPKDNEKDLSDIPKSVLDMMNVNLVETMDEVLKTALAGPLPVAPPPEADLADDAEIGDHQRKWGRAAFYDLRKKRPTRFGSRLRRAPAQFRLQLQLTRHPRLPRDPPVGVPAKCNVGSPRVFNRHLETVDDVVDPEGRELASRRGERHRSYCNAFQHYPWPRLGPCDQAGAQRVSLDIATDVQKIRFRLDWASAITALITAPPPWPHLRCQSCPCAANVHEISELPIAIGPNHEVEMVRHDAIGVKSGIGSYASARMNSEGTARSRSGYQTGAIGAPLDSSRGKQDRLTRADDVEACRHRYKRRARIQNGVGRVLQKRKTRPDPIFYFSASATSDAFAPTRWR